MRKLGDSLHPFTRHLRLTHSLIHFADSFNAFDSFNSLTARPETRDQRPEDRARPGQAIACNCICRSNKSKLSPPGGCHTGVGMLPHRVARGRGGPFQLHFGYTIRASRHCFMAWLLAPSLASPGACHQPGACGNQSLRNGQLLNGFNSQLAPCHRPGLSLIVNKLIFNRAV